jgi:cytidylate kinase
VGRGSAYHLQNRPEAFHVFTYAPFDEKVERLCKGGKTDENAAELVETVDRDRAAFIKEQFGVDWPARHVFHLMVNTTMGVDAAVEVILGAMAAVEKQATIAHDA